MTSPNGSQVSRMTTSTTTPTFVGVEIIPEFFDIACRRIEAAMKQPDLFIEQPKVKPEQLLLLESP